MTRADRTPGMREAFGRVCRDSGFRVDADRACRLVGLMYDVHPLEVFYAMPSWSTMEEIAAGTHPAAQRFSDREQIRARR